MALGVSTAAATLTLKNPAINRVQTWMDGHMGINVTLFRGFS